MAGGVFEWYPSNAFIAYPFEQRLTGINDVFVDAYILHNTAYTGKVRLVSFNAPDISLVKEDGESFCTLGVGEYQGAKVFGIYTLHEWHKTTIIDSGFTDSEFVVRFVVQTAKYSPPVVIPESAFLSSELVSPIPARVKKIGIKINGLPFQAESFLDGTVRFDSGYNMSIKPAADAIMLGTVETSSLVKRVPTEIVFDATPGGGEGLYPTCTEDASSIRTINSQGPAANGNFHLEGQDCSWIERPLELPGSTGNPLADLEAVPKPASLTLHDDCKACCDCEDYKNAYELLRYVWAKARHVADQVEIKRQRYNYLATVADDIVPQEPCSDIIIMKLQAMPDFEIAVGITIRNPLNVRLDNAFLNVTFTPSGFTFINGSGWHDPYEGPWRGDDYQGDGAPNFNPTLFIKTPRTPLMFEPKLIDGDTLRWPITAFIPWAEGTPQWYQDEFMQWLWTLGGSIGTDYYGRCHYSFNVRYDKGDFFRPGAIVRVKAKLESNYKVAETDQPVQLIAPLQKS